MSQLEDIIQIPDNQQRQKALIDYANALKINYRKATGKDGKLSENELIVLIYDAVVSKKKSSLQNIGFFLGALFLLGIILGSLVLLKMMVSR